MKPFGIVPIEIRSQSKISCLVNGKLSMFSLDLLLVSLNRLGRAVDIVIRLKTKEEKSASTHPPSQETTDVNPWKNARADFALKPFEISRCSASGDSAPKGIESYHCCQAVGLHVLLAA